MSSSIGDGPDGVIRLFPLLIETFLKEGWSFEELFVIQKRRITEMLKGIKNGRITVSEAHYNSTDELISEIQTHVHSLQKLVIASSKS